MAAQQSETPWKWILPGVIVPVVVALIGAGIFGPWPGSDDDDDDLPSATATPTRPAAAEPSSNPFGNASVFLSTLSGPGGTRITVSGEGFAPNEEVVLRMQTQEIGRTRANGDGKFSNVSVTIPTSLSVFAPRQFDVVATGSQSIRSARTPFTVSG